MTVSTELRKAGPFLGDGSNKNLPFAFRVFKTSDVRVVWQHDGLEEDLILTTNYSVTLNSDQNSNPGGVVILSIPISVGHTVTLTSKVPYTQGLDIVNAGGFYPDLLETVFDKIVIMVQQVAEQISRVVKLPISSTITAEQLVQRLLSVEVSADAAEAAATAAAASAAAAASIVDPGFLFKEEAGTALTESTNLTAAMAGKWFEVQAENTTQYMPIIANTRIGGTYTFKADKAFTLDGNGANIHASGGEIGASIIVRQGEYITLVKNNDLTGWYVLFRGFSKDGFLTHPVTPKVWLNCGNNGVIYASYNVTSIVDAGVGQVQVNVGNDFADSDYVVNANASGGNENRVMSSILFGPGTFTVYSQLSTSGAGIDPTRYAISAIGNQA